MAQQFLHHLHIPSVVLEDGRVGAAEGVPPDAFLDARFLGCWLDVIAHHLAEPQRLFAALRARAIAVGRKDPIVRCVIRRVTVPFGQITGDVLIERNPIYSPLWQADPDKIRRMAPIEFIGRYTEGVWRQQMSRPP